MARWVRRILAVVLVLVLVAVVATGGLVASVTIGTQPPLDGTFQVPGLSAQVTVRRDANGVTQITADSTHDLFFAQGWVHASERMWQMEIWRRIGAGRLAELFGPSQLDTDRFIRTLGWRHAAERDYAALSDGSKAVLRAYADGVNAWLDEHPGALGVSFLAAGLLSGKGDGLNGLRPEPWTPLDTLTWAKVQGWGLGGNMDSEIFRMLVDQRLGDPALTDQLFPSYPADRPVIAAPEPAAGAASGPVDGAIAPITLDATTSAAWASIGRVADAIPVLAGLSPTHGLIDDGGVGSNNWVVAPSKSADGNALLANDPHLGFNMPSVWYVNGLHCRPVGPDCPYDVTGVTFPGTPGVIAGHNARIAWGVTNANPDVEDLVEERVDPTDPSRYLTASGSAPFTVRTETIRVAGRPDVQLTVRSTVHGPILNGVDTRLTGTDPLFALRWTALQDTDRVLEAFLRIDQADSFAEFRDALRLFGAPAQNFVYADVDGHIGYQLPGDIPVRTLASDHGLRPVPGWDGQHEWVSRVPFDDLPSVLDPPSGRIATANNPIDGGSVFLGEEYDRGDRAARILQLLDAAGSQVTLDTMAAIQGDTLLLRASRLVPGVVDLAPRPATADGQAVLDAITSWDDRCPVDSIGCSAYVTFELALERAVFDDDLGPQARDYVGSGYAEDLVANLVSTPEGRASAWWGDVRSGTTADPATVTAAALDTAGAWLRRDLGDPSGWTWGRIHQVGFREATLGSSGIGPLEWYFDAGAQPVAGASGAVDNTYYQLGSAYPDPTDPSAPVATTLPQIFAVTNGPSMRALYDLGNLDAGRIITTTGQSGQPFSPHVSDWIGHWLRNETVPLPFSDAAVSAATTDTLVLQPGP